MKQAMGKYHFDLFCIFALFSLLLLLSHISCRTWGTPLSVSWSWLLPNSCSGWKLSMSFSERVCSCCCYIVLSSHHVLQCACMCTMYTIPIVVWIEMCSSLEWDESIRQIKRFIHTLLHSIHIQKWCLFLCSSNLLWIIISKPDPGDLRL